MKLDRLSNGLLYVFLNVGSPKLHKRMFSVYIIL